MSGHRVQRALQRRFDSIRRAEIARLDKKLRGLSVSERAFVESVVSDIVLTISRIPEQMLSTDTPAETLEAFIRVFDLRSESSAG